MDPNIVIGLCGLFLAGIPIAYAIYRHYTKPPTIRILFERATDIEWMRTGLGSTILLDMNFVNEGPGVITLTKVGMQGYDNKSGKLRTFYFSQLITLPVTLLESQLSNGLLSEITVEIAPHVVYFIAIDSFQRTHRSKKYPLKDLVRETTDSGR